jgi:hypothetical protein
MKVSSFKIQAEAGGGGLSVISYVGHEGIFIQDTGLGPTQAGRHFCPGLSP